MHRGRTAHKYNMATALPTPITPTLPNAQSSLPKPPTVKAPKISKPPTKINVKSGKGAPGGFTGKNTTKISAKKLPSVPKAPAVPKVTTPGLPVAPVSLATKLPTPKV